MLDKDPFRSSADRAFADRAAVRAAVGRSRPGGLPAMGRPAPASLSLMAEDEFSRGEVIRHHAVVAAHQMELLGWMEIPAILVNQDSSVVDLTAGALDGLGDDLLLCNKRLAARDRSSNERLDTLIRAAFDGHSRLPLRRHAIVARQHGRPLLVSLVWRQSHAQTATVSFAILALVNTDLRPSPDQTVLRAAFDLTASEARLAEYIATGASLADAAAKFGIARGTAAKQLKFIFEKTDTHRQAELVSLLARFTIWVPHYAAGYHILP